MFLSDGAVTGNFSGRHHLYPCINGRIMSNPTLEGLYDIHGEIFFVTHKIRTDIAVTQYYIFNLDTCKLIRFKDNFPTLEAFMERVSHWTGGDAQIKSVTPFELMDINPGPREVVVLKDEWNAVYRDMFMRGLASLS
ncbi:uncharacterized protein EV420DRAFT_1766393 [Desarmillaria tabescens]|uniref:Uncharacterized protein n=1 Tax=Armillaria tabescens TaxID=1929756 RepID=A0AA39K0T4_ARMTA|nr:uncharacterized protein EV420DRAFT_1766393 [Desarmillaria tabescens]KAK0451350.1 hypothetical protein EV420DRAFT_1766393 [Desarmillaria tabescens]